MVIIYWYKAVGTSRGKTQVILLAQTVLIIQARLQMLQKTHHRVCKTPVKYSSCYIWHWQTDEGDAKPSVCNKNPVAEREKNLIAQPFNELGGRCQHLFAEKAFQKKVFQSLFQLVDFYLHPAQSLVHVRKALELFSQCAQNSKCFWFSYLFSSLLSQWK